MTEFSRISVRIPEDLNKRIKTAAIADDLTLQDLYAKALTQWLNRRDGHARRKAAADADDS